ncbi:hypothetical protein [Trabulsiella guamensis]
MIGALVVLFVYRKVRN